MSGHSDVAIAPVNPRGSGFRQELRRAGRIMVDARWPIFAAEAQLAGAARLLAAHEGAPSAVVEGRALRYVGPAVLSALTINLIAGGQGIGGVEFVEVAALGVAIVVAAVARNLLAALGAGMVTLWLLLWLL